MHVSTSRQLLRLCVLAVLGCAAIYVLALGTNRGMHLDARALPRGVTGPGWDRANAALRRAVETVHVATIALAACLAALVALRRRRGDLAMVAIATVAGANLTTHLLKPLLAGADPFGGEEARAVEASFPSGHATAAMSLALVAVIAAPRRWRGWVALGAAAYAACVGVGLVLGVSHYPSDVAGGYLVATAWAAATAAIAVHRRESRELEPAAPSPPSPAFGVAAIAGLALVIVGAGAVVAILLHAPRAHLQHGLFAVAAVGIAVLALVLPVAVAALLARDRQAASLPGGSER